MKKRPYRWWTPLSIALLAVMLTAAALAQPPLDEPVPEGVEPVNAWESHPAQESGRLAPVMRGGIHMRDVPEPSPGAEQAPPYIRQGYPGTLSDRGIELVPSGWPEPAVELPDPEAPEITDHNTDPEAVGDFVASFEGIRTTTDFSTSFPPDTVLAVGPGHVLEAVNRGFVVYSKTGSVVQSYRSFRDFFDPVEPSSTFNNYFDPRVIYDSFHDQYVMLALGRDDNAQESYVFLAVSAWDDPTGFWYMYRYHVDTGSNTDYWLDYASLGADLWGVYFTGNYFKWSNDDFKYATLFSVGPAVFSGGSGAGWQFWDLKWTGIFPGKAFGLQVAHPHSQSSGETFFVNTKWNSGDDILLWELTGDRTSSPSLSKSRIGMRDYDAIGNNVDQPGTATDLDGGDSRVLSAVYAQRRVYATLASAPTNNSGGWVTVRVNVDSTNKEWDTLLWGGDGVYYIYPAITISGGTSSCARIGLMGSWANNTTRNPSGLFKIYESCNSTSGPFISFVSGLSPYERVFDGRNRWGDYSGAAYDWSTGHFWGAVEYAESLTNWRTRIAARKFAPDLQANFTYFCYGLDCNFYNASSGGVLPLTSYLWTFGDTGQTTTSSPAYHSFLYAGTFQVTLKVTDSTGAMSTHSKWITVTQQDPCGPELIQPCFAEP